MPLNDDINALMQQLVDRAETLVDTASPQELALLGHAVAATRGTAALQAIVDAAVDAIADVDSAKAASLQALIDALAVHQTTMQGQATTLQSQLIAVRDSSVDAIQNVWLAVAGMRIGDIAWRLFPNSGSIPEMMLPLVGGSVVAADYNALCSAWGLNGGQTPCEFVTRYNSTNPFGITVRKESNILYLPNMSGFFPQGVGLTDMGKYFPDMLKTHTHDSPSGGQFVLNGTGTTGGTTTGTAKVQGNVTGAPTAAVGLEVGSKNKPEAMAGLFIVRAL